MTDDIQAKIFEVVVLSIPEAECADTDTRNGPLRNKIVEGSDRTQERAETGMVPTRRKNSISAKNYPINEYDTH